MHLNEDGTATVELSDDHIIVCRLVGKITGDVVAGSMRETRVLAERARTEGYTPLLLIDISKITKQTSEARTRAKELNTMKLKRVAISGGSQGIVLAGKYIAKAAGMEGYTRFFKDENTARDWLVSGVGRSAADSTLAKRSIVSLLMIILGVSALVGWQLNVPALRSIVPDLAPMNPLTAVMVLLLAVAIMSMGKGWRAGRLRRLIVSVAAMGSIFFGVAILARYLFSVDTGLDTLLYADKLEWGGFSGRAAQAVGVFFVSSGAMLALLLTEQRQIWLRHVFFGLSGVVFVLSMGILVGYGFGFDWLTDLGSDIPIAITSTLAFICFNFGVVGLARPSRSYAASIRIFYAYWQAIVVGLILFFATGISWQQVKNNISDSVDAAVNESFLKVQNDLTSRLRAYTDALNGYKGLFAASDDVSPNEFNEYFVSSEIQANYPGFLAITYIAAVPDGQKQAFINHTRARANDTFPQYRMFAPYPENNNGLHLPVLYTEPHTPSTRYGFDLSSEATRRKTLEEARDTGMTIGSEVINLNASQGANAAERPGFFIAAPVYRPHTGKIMPSDLQSRRNQIQGFILAYFQNDRLFANIFSANDNAQYTISDAASGKVVHTSTAKNVTQSAEIVQTAIVPAGAKSWRLTMRVSPKFGITHVYRRLPSTVLITGFALSALATLLIMGQLRKRDQALQTAAEITEDLNKERNAAVAIQRKDEAILTSIGDAVFAIDVKGRITLFNLACERISGYSASEVIGKHYADVLHFSFEKSGRVNDGFIRQALAGHITSMKNHTVLRRKDGKIVSVADSAAPIYDVGGKLLGVIVVFRDVSKEYELDRAKNEFVSLASHQLRTPLSAINWYGELLLGGDAGELNKMQREYIEQMHHGSLRMIELVNSLLDVSRLDLGKLSNQPVPNDMYELATALKGELMTMIQSKDLRVSIDAPKNLHAVSADPKLLRMIVQNLFSNAVKYTPVKGEVSLMLRQASPEEAAKAHLRGEAYCYLMVKDTGYGIPESQQSKIFGKLFRADNVQALDVEGTGLGLYIVKQVVEKLGGKVWFESAENKGTTFYVLLPFKTKVMKSNSKQPGDA